MYDLHTHSDFSDGTLPPEKIIQEAKEKGLTLLALCDHDTVTGIPDAAAAAKRHGMPFLCGIELEAEFPTQLHILGLGIDINGKKLTSLLEVQKQRRLERNERLLKKLADGGMSIYEYIGSTKGLMNKSNIAAAMVRAGYCGSIPEAFDRFLKRGRPFHVAQEYPKMPEVLEAVLDAGGLPVLAHPMKMKCDHRELVMDMKEHGLWGIEAYYSAATEEQTDFFLKLARDFMLRPTCGSDFHGPHRPEAQLGCAWRDTTDLFITEGLIKSLYGITEENPVGSRKNSEASRIPEAGRTAVPVRGRRGYSLNEFQALCDRAAARIPEEFFKGLNGGVVIAGRAKLHRKSQPGRPLYILGEYHYGGSEGRYITLYYGSFLRVKGGLSGEALEEEIRRVLLHEFRHHLESRAGERGLEIEDDLAIAEYLGENT